MELAGDVLVTGGAGFLARGLYRRAEHIEMNARFTCLSRDDAKHAALQKRYPNVRTVLGDVASMDVEDMTRLFRGFDTVIHAAASKYVDRAELAAADTVRTNVEGSRNVVRAAERAGVGQLVAISTDKACEPVNVYGMSKAVMERLVQEAAFQTYRSVEYRVVRYGNVVGSTGSVIPMFMEAVRNGLPIRVTDPLMTRFWMSIDEAVDTILWAIDWAATGTVTVPPMRAMEMKNLVRACMGIDSYGPLPDEGVEVVGVRPGEKRHEKIVHSQEAVRAIRHSSGWIEMLPPGQVGDGQSFELTSRDPMGWVGCDELRAMVEDAARV